MYFDFELTSGLRHWLLKAKRVEKMAIAQFPYKSIKLSDSFQYIRIQCILGYASVLY